jgi:hypothetical protein
MRFSTILIAWVTIALAEALSIELIDLLSHPDRPSANDLLRTATPEIHAKANSIIRLLIEKAS